MRAFSVFHERYWYKMPSYAGIKPAMNPSEPRRLLGAFIRAHRERLSPPAKAVGRRRTPGWRREELADAAGLGVTWITWLEQGRAVNASVPALCRLAEALQLTPAERMSLFDLAGKRDPLASHAPTTDLPAELLCLPGHVSAPAYLLDASYAAIAWNDQAGELFVGWLDTGAEQPNLLEFVFLSERARDLLVDWPERTRRLLAEFRADFNRDPGDVRLQALAESLAERSRDFERIWRSQEVLNRDGGVRTFSHPERGELQFFQTTFHLASHAGVKLVCLLPLCRDADQGIGDASDQA